MKILVFISLFIFNIVAYSGTINVGVLKFAPPFSSFTGDGNHYYGFVIDLMGNICLRINEKCTYKAVKAGAQFDSLKQETIDISFIPVPIASEPSGNFIFSLPYLASKGQFLTLKENKINELSEIKNLKIGVVKNTLYPLLIRTQYAETNTIKEYDKFTDLFAALASNEIAVIYINATVAKYIINNALRQLKLVGSPIAMGEGYAIMALKKNAALIKKINSALLALQADGTYLAIYKRYFGR